MIFLMNRFWKSVIVGLVILILLILSIVISVYFLRQRTTFLGRASDSSITLPGGVEIKNSYLFASPLQAKSNGQEKIRVTVFILDDQGKGVPQKQVILGQDGKLTTTIVQALTDDFGRAIFDVASANSGEFLIEAAVEGKALPQKVKLIFL